MALNDNLARIRDAISAKTSTLGIKYEIRVVAVTKTLPAEAVREAVGLGLTAIGENRVQEAEKKFAELADLRFEKHLVGHLQENKANKAAALFDWVQSLDGAGAAARLDRKCGELGKKLSVLVEVNTSGEPAKSGVAMEAALDFAAGLAGLKNLDLRGFMTVGPLDGAGEGTRTAFRNLARILEKARAQLPSLRLDVLSMGMSDDYLIAVEEGATMLRLGRALFGERA